MRAILTSLIIGMLLMGGLCSCEYPEQGYFELVGLDEEGRLRGRQLFIVEEYVDDSEMTTGFGLLLPHIDGEHLVSIPLEATDGFESRGWIVRTNVRQTGLGNLLLEMTHIGERLKLQGSLHVAGRDAAEPFHATVRSADGVASILFVGEQPALPEEFSGATKWQLRRLEADSFEALCGLTLDSPILPLMPWDMYETEDDADSARSQLRDPGPDRGDAPEPTP